MEKMDDYEYAEAYTPSDVSPNCLSTVVRATKKRAP